VEVTKCPEINGSATATPIAAATSSELQSNVLVDFFDRNADGSIVLPKGVTDVIIDVGLSQSPILPSSDSQMVIGFEPVYEASESNNKNYQAKFKNRFISIPVAAGHIDGYAVFHDHVADKGTSSLLPTNEQGIEESTKTRPGNMGNAMHEARRRIVPLVRLESLLLAIPKNVRISFLKVDAQGADCYVLKGCGEGMKRVEKVKAEVAVLFKVYEGACRQPEMEGIMRDFGFELEETLTQSDNLEADLVFRRK